MPMRKPLFENIKNLKSREKFSTLESRVRSSIYQLELDADLRVETRAIDGYEFPVIIILPKAYDEMA